MSRVLTCVGKYAENPLYVDKVYANVYSIEELCYVFYENAFLLDKDIVDKRTAIWIEKELNLPDLARNLYGLINANASAAAFVGTILSYTGYYSKDEIAKTESILRLNVSMNAFEKLKAKADFLVENKHYVLGIAEYDKLLEILPEEEEELRSKIYNNLGITYMKLYLFDSAEKCFLAAYEATNNETAYKHYLTVKRMSLKDDEYVRFVASHSGAYKESISLETEFLDAKAEFDSTDEAAGLRNIFALRTGPDAAIYYDEIGRITESLKEGYRDIVLETEKGINSRENID